MNFNNFKNILPNLINICIKTGEYQIEHHKKSLKFKVKENQTPVTEVDIHSSDMIKNALNKLTPDILVISEEDYPEKNDINYFWIIDPLDGTKNYLRGNDSFCINIALIKNGEPILGLIYSPIFQLFFYAFKGHGAYKKTKNEKPVLIKTKKFSIEDKIIIYTSSSIHDDVCQKLRSQFQNIEIISTSSALKFGYIASGEGSFYPRLGPTHEWDTASGQCIIEEAGGLVVNKFMERLVYNKNPKYLNDEFFVIADPAFDWEEIIKTTIS